MNDKPLNNALGRIRYPITKKINLLGRRHSDAIVSKFDNPDNALQQTWITAAVRTRHYRYRDSHKTFNADHGNRHGRYAAGTYSGGPSDGSKTAST